VISITLGSLGSIEAIVPSMQSDAITLKLNKNWQRALIGLLLLGVGYLAYWVGTFVWNDIITRIANTSAEVARVQITLDKALTSFDLVKTSLQDQRVSIAVLEMRLLNLEKPHYESKAKALGFKNPQIVPTSLQTNAKFESRTPGPTGEYFLQFTILAYDPLTSIIRLRFDAQLPNGPKFENNTLIINIKSGAAEELTHYFIQTGVPKIYLQVLDISVRDQAILAIGHKPDEAGKRS
jgi:uncharacterized membrane protein YidH (DUF202 family)